MTDPPQWHRGRSFPDGDQWGLCRARIDHAKAGGNAGVEQWNIFLMDQGEKLLRFLVGDDKFDLHGERTRKLEELRFTQLVMPPESGHGAKRRAAVDAELIRLYEQPFPCELVMMPLPFMDIQP